jgi:hypothetical protein
MTISGIEPAQASSFTISKTGLIPGAYRGHEKANRRQRLR